MKEKLTQFAPLIILLTCLSFCSCSKKYGCYFSSTERTILPEIKTDPVETIEDHRIFKNQKITPKTTESKRTS